MKRRPSPPVSTEMPPAEAGAILQVKVWLTGISPMVWRRVLVPATFTLRELHGVIQVAMGWEGIHLHDFHLRAARYGSHETGASSPEVTLAALRFRKGARFIYEYDLNIPWRHEVRIEDRLEPEVRKGYPVCTGGGGACPPEDCGGPEHFMAARDAGFPFEALEDLDTMAGILGRLVEGDGAMLVSDAIGEEERRLLEAAVEQSEARERARGRPFSRRAVNAALRRDEHHALMHQQY